MASRKRTSTASGANTRERLRRCDPAPYALSCALYALACGYLNRCDMASLISRIMQYESDIRIASEIIVSLRNAGVSDDVISQLWRRYIL